MIKTILVYDTNNIFHKNYHKNKNFGTVEEALDMTMAASIREMKSYYDKLNPTMTMAAFDSKTNWRKVHTKNKLKRVTDRVYKANRNEKKTKKEKEAKKLLDERIQDFAKFLKESTKIVVLWEELLEADDLAAGVCRIFGDSEFDIKIVSSDKDYLQFYRYPNVEIINPLFDGKKRNLDDWNNDADLYLFEKCIRGDRKDNVRSSYPRLRRDKLVEAYYDDLKRSNVLNHSFTETIYDEDTDEYIEKEYSTEALFEENKMLLDLNCQPEDIRELTDSVVEREVVRKRKINFVRFLQFCQKYELNNMKNRAQNFMPFLSNKCRS